MRAGGECSHEEYQGACHWAMIQGVAVLLTLHHNRIGEARAWAFGKAGVRLGRSTVIYQCMQHSHFREYFKGRKLGGAYMLTQGRPAMLSKKEVSGDLAADF